MKIEHINGNLLTEKCDIICHQVNCLGVMGAGIAAQIKEKWDNVFELYHNICTIPKNSEELLGDCQIVKVNDTNISYVANLFGQNLIGRKGTLTNYTALEEAMRSVAEFANETYPNGCVVGFPYKIGCGIASGDWDIVFRIIENVFKNTNITVKIVEYNG